jgi:hypothetical protein
MYDFETNEKFWWGPGDMDRWDDYGEFAMAQASLRLAA